MQVNLHDAKTHLSRCVAQALEGKEVVIAKAGHPSFAWCRCKPLLRPGAADVCGVLRWRAPI